MPAASTALLEIRAGRSNAIVASSNTALTAVAVRVKSACRNWIIRKRHDDFRSRMQAARHKDLAAATGAPLKLVSGIPKLAEAASPRAAKPFAIRQSTVPRRAAAIRGAELRRNGAASGLNRSNRAAPVLHLLSP